MHLITVLKHTKEKLRELNIKIGKFIIILRQFNTLLSVTDRLMDRKADNIKSLKHHHITGSY